MFSADNFYNFLHHYYNDDGQQIQFHAFSKHGTRDLADFHRYGIADSNLPSRLISQAALFDQEPIEPEYFTDWINYSVNDLPEVWKKLYKPTSYYKSLSPMDFVFRHLSGVTCPILCHSEQNSDSVKLFSENHFYPVHYFYHGLLAREWFRHWKHYSMKKDSSSARLGLYARDGSGSRAYRVELLKRLSPFKASIYYRHQPELADLLPNDVKRNWPFNNVAKGPESSARIDVADAANFQIQLVPETLFNTEKTHLTEKVFKPMVMKQPFIVVGPPNSLEYLRNYGFRTFDGLWDEQYDRETNPELRMQLIIDVVQYLTSLNDEAFRRVMDRAQRIVEHNHQHFFSHEFEDQILNELYSNFDSAILYQQEKFYTMPGGTWFLYQNKIVQTGQKQLTSNKKINKEIVDYLIANNQSNVAGQILSTYQHLF